MLNHINLRKKTIAEANCIIIKVGSAVLTDKNGVNMSIINSLVEQISCLHDRNLSIVLVSSGAVAAGRSAIGLQKNISLQLSCKQAASAIGQSRLMKAYDEAFHRYAKISAQVLLTRDDLTDRERFLNARNTFSRLLSWRAIPVVNENDTVAIQELKFGDNDNLSALVANLIAADLIINLTSADGLFDSNPDINKNAKIINYVEDIASLDIDSLTKGKTISGTGGMQSKLIAASKAAKIGVPTLIVSGKLDKVLDRVFTGENIGTWIFPERKSITQKKFWLAFNLKPAGEIRIDAGAYNALRYKGTSLLPVGIVGIQGEFGIGDLVRIVSLDGKIVGVGLINYTVQELIRIMGKKSIEITQLIGLSHPEEAIHRDNMLIENH